MGLVVEDRVNIQKINNACDQIAKEFKLSSQEKHCLQGSLTKLASDGLTYSELNKSLLESGIPVLDEKAREKLAPLLTKTFPDFKSSDYTHLFNTFSRVNDQGKSFFDSALVLPPVPANFGSSQELPPLMKSSEREVNKLFSERKELLQKLGVYDENDQPIITDTDVNKLNHEIVADLGLPSDTALRLAIFTSGSAITTDNELKIYVGASEVPLITSLDNDGKFTGLRLNNKPVTISEVPDMIEQRQNAIEKISSLINESNFEPGGRRYYFHNPSQGNMALIETSPQKLEVFFGKPGEELKPIGIASKNRAGGYEFGPLIEKDKPVLKFSSSPISVEVLVGEDDRTSPIPEKLLKTN